jgi:uncharacterized protein YbjQ (UPF0145 family)
VANEAELLYRAAYKAHYSERDTGKALAGYCEVVERHPDSPEASYARTQIENLERERERRDASKRFAEVLPEEESSSPSPVILTTAPSLEGYQVTNTIEVISAECAYGMNVFRDFFAAVTDFVGGRSKATQNVLRDARRECLAELSREALKVGANAVVAINLAYSEFSGHGKSMLFLVATGTAVHVERRAPDDDGEVARTC